MSFKSGERPLSKIMTVIEYSLFLARIRLALSTAPSMSSSRFPICLARMASKSVVNSISCHDSVVSISIEASWRMRKRQGVTPMEA